MSKNSESIDFHRRVMKNDMKITTEGFASSMRTFIPNIFSGLVASFTDTALENEVINLPRDQRKFLELVSKVSYNRLSEATVVTPEGLVTNYLQLAQTLKQAVVHSKEKLDESLNHYGRYIAVLINNPTMWLSTKDEMVYYSNLEKDRTALASLMDACYDPGNHNTSTQYQDVVGRNNDWYDILKTTLEVSDALNGFDRKQIKKSITNIVELVELIRSKAKVDGGLNDNISSQVLTGIADGAYQIAKELEFHAVIHYRALALTTALTESIALVTEYANTLGVET